MAGITKWRESAMNKAKKLTEVKNGAPVQAAINGSLTIAGAGAAGVLDAKMGDFQGMKPSIAAGLVTATLGLVTKSPKVIHVAAGALAPHAYNAAFDWAKKAA